VRPPIVSPSSIIAFSLLSCSYNYILIEVLTEKKAVLTSFLDNLEGYQCCQSTRLSGC
jgi:hypothetical protein